MNKYKLQNTPIDSNQASAPPAKVQKALNVNAFSFVPGAAKAPKPVAPKPVVDIVAENCKALKLTDEETTAFKEILKLGKEDKESRGTKPISIDLFAKVCGLKLCSGDKENVKSYSHCLNVHIAERVVSETMKSKGGRNNNNRQKNYNNRNRDDDNGDFNKGSKMHQRNNWKKEEEFPIGMWKMEDTAEKAKLKEKAKAMYEKVNMTKNETQQIRLILNIITPDN